MNKLLIIGFVWPEPKGSAAGSRMLQLIQLFLDQGYDITFVSTSRPTENSADLTEIGVKTKTILLNHSSFNDFVKNLQPDVVLFDRFITEEQYGWRISEYCSNALRILDTEDLHGLRKGREKALKAREPFSFKHLLNDTTKRELASIYRSDLSLIISETEIELLQNQLKIPKDIIHYLPFILDEVSKNHQDSLPSFDERQHFVFIGNFLHPPNYDALLYLKQNIWSKIRQKLPTTELHIYGAYTSHKISQLHHVKDGFIIKGFAKDANEIMAQARVCLAPLRYGAGLKGKLIDAMKNGTPSIMSTIAAEGMFGALEPSGYVSNIPEVFAQKAVTLYHDKMLWQDFQNKGFTCINERFNHFNFKADFIDKITTIKKKINHYRSKNITGQLLQYHSLQSTKYMSKWIEEKNKQIH